MLKKFQKNDLFIILKKIISKPAMRPPLLTSVARSIECYYDNTR